MWLNSGVDHLLNHGASPAPDEPEEAPVKVRGIGVPGRFESTAEWLE